MQHLEDLRDGGIFGDAGDRLAAQHHAECVEQRVIDVIGESDVQRAAISGGVRGNGVGGFQQAHGNDVDGRGLRGVLLERERRAIPLLRQCGNDLFFGDQAHFEQPLADAPRLVAFALQLQGAS